MCGIAGIWNMNGAPARVSDLRAMLGAIGHRGPEGAAYSVLGGGSVALGFLRLGFTAGGVCQQPLFNEDGSEALVYNGEIYDYLPAQRELVRQGHRFRTTSDSEVLLHLHEEHGDDFARRLNGEFAFALWLENERRLLLVRDRFGVKPLFYSRVGHTFAFASELKAIRALGLLPNELDPRFFFGPGVALGGCEVTSFRGIESVKPAHLVEVSSRGVRSRPYWEPSFAGQPEKPRDHEQHRTVRQLVTRAVERRLEGNPPIALSLSSGVDSSIVAGVAANVSRQTSTSLTAFTLGFPSAAYDESAQAALTAKRLGLRHEVVEVSPTQLANGFVSAIGQIEVPTNSLTVVARIELSRAIRRSGFKAVMSGEGSDELFGGYPYFGFEAIERAVGPHSNAMKAFAKAEARSKGIFWSPLAQRASPTPHAEGWPARYPSLYAQRIERVERQLGWLLQPSFFDQRDRTLPWRAVSPLLADERVTPFDKTRIVSRELLGAVVIPGLGDRVEMAGSLEGRVPYLDRDVVDFAYTLPEAACIDPSTFVRKRVLRTAFADLLHDLAPPSKTTLMVPSFTDLHACRAGREVLEPLLSPSAVRRAGVFNPLTVRAVLTAWRVAPRWSSWHAPLDLLVGFIASTQALHVAAVEGGRSTPLPESALELRRPLDGAFLDLQAASA